MRTHLGYALNECGTKISVHRCKTCGILFWLCPPVARRHVRKKRWQNCLSVDCASYDGHRDVDLLFDAGMSNFIVRRGEK